MLGWVTIVFAVIATASLLLASFLVYPKISTVSSQIWGNRVAFVCIIEKYTTEITCMIGTGGLKIFSLASP